MGGHPLPYCPPSLRIKVEIIKRILISLVGGPLYPTATIPSGKGRKY
jgi:hypothetical protein